MSANTPQNYRVQGQAPLDAKLIFTNIAAFNSLKQQNPAYAFDFYKGMKVYFQEEEKMYIWENPFSDNYKENEKLLTTNFIYPTGSVYESLDYSGKAFNLIELPYKIENIGLWNDNNNLTVDVVIYEGSTVNPFDPQQIHDLWPDAERIAFIGGEITGLKLFAQPIQLFQEFFVSNWGNLSYDIWNNSSDYVQNARIRIIYPGEIVDYNEYSNRIIGNAFKEIKIIRSEFEILNKNSLYFKEKENDPDEFEILVTDKSGISKKFARGATGPAGDIALLNFRLNENLELIMDLNTNTDLNFKIENGNLILVK